MSVIEVLVAGTILMITASALYMFVWQAFSDWNRVRKELSVYQNVSRALELITTDLRRVPPPFFASTPAGGTGDPIVINADPPPMKPLNYAFKGGPLIDPINSLPNNDPPILMTIGSSIMFRINFLDQKKLPAKFVKVLVRYFGIFPKVSNPTDPNYTELDPAIANWRGRPGTAYQKLMREVCEQNPLLLNDPAARKRTQLGYQWVTEEPDPALPPGENRFKWKDSQVVLDNLEEFHVEFLAGTGAVDPRWGSGPDMGLGSTWDFFTKIGYESSGGLPAAVRLVLSAWSPGHTPEDFDRETVHKDHRLVTMRTCVMLPVWRYE